MEKVVKCRNKKCGLYFGYAEKKTKCPFCKTEYDKAEEKPRDPSTSLGAGKKLTFKTQKDSFKIWKDK